MAVELAELVAATVGEQRYRDACAWAWRTAAGTGRGGGAEWPADLADVPHELSDLWWRDDLPLGRRLELALELYREMPCYANAMFFASFHRELGTAERRTLWDAYRGWLASADDRLADPIAYSLWVDFFEDRAAVAEAWHETTRQDVEPSRRRLARVLRCAGPVPWAVKAPLLETLLGSVDWHGDVLRALEGSAFDVYGELDRAVAARWLERLRLPEAQLAPLRERLTSAGPSAGPGSR